MVLRKKGRDTQSNSIVAIAKMLLIKKKRPVHFKELCNVILKYKKLQTVTPQESVRTILSLSNNFDSYGKGMYGLKSWGYIWYKLYYNRGDYFSIRDICYKIIKKIGPTNINILSAEVDRLYPNRYANLRCQIKTAMYEDARFEISKTKIRLRKYKKEDFKPNDIDSILTDVAVFLKKNERPELLANLMKIVNVKPCNNMDSKKILVLWLLLDSRFIKLGPKSHYGLLTWIE